MDTPDVRSLSGAASLEAPALAEAPALPRASTCYERADCRLCNSRALYNVLSLPATPPANAFAAAPDADAIRYPLELRRCDKCGNVQLGHVVAPEVLFGNYTYSSGTSPSFVGHFTEYAQWVIDRYRPPSSGIVVDVGANDGTFVRALARVGLSPVAVEPSASFDTHYHNMPFPRYREFLTPRLAQDIAHYESHAHVVTANNVFAHVNDLDSFVRAIWTLLAPNGIFIVETQWLWTLVEHGLWDMIYHEHLQYHTLTTLIDYMAARDFTLEEAQVVSAHGGSLRIAWRKREQTLRQTVPRGGTRNILAAERPLFAPGGKIWEDFAERVADSRKRIWLACVGEAYHSAPLYGYGAPAKATTLIHTTATHLAAIADDTLAKQGRYIPGTTIPIVSSNKLFAQRPKRIIVFPWNVAGDIINRHRSAHPEVQWIIPLPTLRIV